MSKPIGAQQNQVLVGDLVGADGGLLMEIGLTGFFRFFLLSGTTQPNQEPYAGLSPPCALGKLAQILFPALLQMDEISFFPIGVSERLQPIFLLGFRDSGREGGS